ncbi:MAG: efflux transporter outer membrane subunit [Proteobacteria bacterium]|nr:efflux transporter outer membrane subunit [Pseudomonadota bacterium]
MNLPQRSVAALLTVLGLSACGVLPRVGPDYQAPAIPTPAGWQAPQPHNGQIAELTDWWRRLDDPLLPELINAAERESASLAQARARIAQARASAVAADVAGLPTVDGSLAAKRAAFTFGAPTTFQTTRQASVMANWEIDLFGGLARDQQGAEARLAASAARWHAARVSVAAETADAYLQLRYQERRLAQAEADATSRAATFELTRKLGTAGFNAPADVALAGASAADGTAAVADLRAARDRQVKALVALTGIDETRLRQQLAGASGRFPTPAAFAIDTLPARLLTQRPDVAAAERDLAAASAAIGSAAAERYPRLTLAGVFTPLRLNTNGQHMSATTWSISPTLAMPLFDGGRVAANVEAARADYAAAEAAYRQTVRTAVSEVEQALVRLDAAATREADVRRAAAGYRQAYGATEARQRAGFASLLELEDARRTLLAADTTVAGWEQERASAWIALYRAIGGGWTATDTAAPQVPQAPSPDDAR